MAQERLATTYRLVEFRTAASSGNTIFCKRLRIALTISITSALVAVLCVAAACADEGSPADETQRLIHATRHIVERLSKAASELPKELEAKDKGDSLTGDSLTEHYMKSAAAAALELDKEIASKAMLLGVAIACDRNDFLRKLPLLGAIVDQVDPKEQRAARLKNLGHPTIHGREDLVQHFLVSAYLTALAGPTAAHAAGVAKEMKDANGESGFSFVDLAADRAGIDFASRVLSNEVPLKSLVGSFKLKLYVPDISGLDEGLTLMEFQREFGSTSDERFIKVISDIDHRVEQLANSRKKTAATAKSGKARNGGP